MGLSTLSIVWLCGALLCAMAFVLTHLRSLGKYRAALPVESALVSAWKKGHEIRRDYRIRCSDRISAPISYGVLRPVILLPKNTDWSNGRQLEYILGHELIHIKRFDILKKWLLAGLLSFYWFNPFVWLMYILANRDMELSCDEALLRRAGGGERAQYALTLLALESRRGGDGPLFNYFSKNPVEERVRAIMKSKSGSLSGKIAALAVTAATLALLFISGCGGADPAGGWFEASSYSFSPDRSFTICAADLYPGSYAASEESYYLDGDSVLMAAITWADTSQGLRLGFVSEEDSAVQYWSEISRGGSLTPIGSENAVKISPRHIPAGSYYLCLSAPPTNTAELKSLTAVFEWR